MVDFSKISLSDEERAAFKKFKKTDSAFLTAEEFKLLRQTKLIENSMDGSSGYFDALPSSGKCVLSVNGKRYKAFLKERKLCWIMNSFIWPVIVSLVVNIIIGIARWLL